MSDPAPAPPPPPDAALPVDVEAALVHLARLEADEHWTSAVVSQAPRMTKCAPLLRTHIAALTAQNASLRSEAAALVAERDALRGERDWFRSRTEWLEKNETRRVRREALEWALLMDEKARGGLGNKGSWRKMAEAEIARLKAQVEAGE